MHARTKTSILALLAAFVLIGCSQETLGPDSGADAPILPPAESMQFDLSFFGRGNAAAGGPAAALSEEEAALKLNWLNAAVRVAFINVAVVTIFTPPALAFHAAVHQKPIVEEDGTFLWTYTWVQSPGHEVVIHLRGRIDGIDVDWNLRITDLAADPPLDEFLWFYGRSNLLANEGFWIFNDIDELGEVPVARIDWDLEDEADSELRFENIDRGSVEYGDRLTYRSQDPIMSVLFFDASEDLEADITWNEVTNAGSLQVPDYNDGERACWDETLEDSICPDEAS